MEFMTIGLSDKGLLSIIEKWRCCYFSFLEVQSLKSIIYHDCYYYSLIKNRAFDYHFTALNRLLYTIFEGTSSSSVASSMGRDSKPELKYRADVSLLLVLRSLFFFFSSLVFFIALPRLDGILLEDGVGISSYSSFDSSGTY